jgi:competence protein ComEC
MIAIVLVGVMVDRPAITLRTLMVAAIIVLLLTPRRSSIRASRCRCGDVGAGRRLRARPVLDERRRETPAGAHRALGRARDCRACGCIVARRVRDHAVRRYHFHRLAPYGVVANLLAMPIVSAWVMPMGIAGVLAMPFGFDGLFWHAMGAGIDWMITVAAFVAGLPGAVGRMAAFGVGPLLLGSAGLVVLCLLRSPLRLAGALLLAVASQWAVRTPQPDVLISADAQTFAVRGADGRLAIVRSGSDTFAARQWLAADADARSPAAADVGAGIRCDHAGCVGQLADGRVIALARSLEAFEEDCRRAAVVVSPRVAPRNCAALAIDRDVLQQTGAVALRRSGDGFEMTTARPPGYHRPWAQARPSRSRTSPSTPTQTPVDATPRADDLEPGD